MTRPPPVTVPGTNPPLLPPVFRDHLYIQPLPEVSTPYITTSSKRPLPLKDHFFLGPDAVVIVLTVVTGNAQQPIEQVD
jgi:hypothetical protein